jgi:L-threonine kinase
MSTDALHLEVPQATVRVRAPGTCGEFVQGHIRGQDFLVNCPIDLYAHAGVTAHVRAGLAIERPEQHLKIRDTLTLAAHELMLPMRHAVAVRSRIPRGKGMASSSADIAAALSAFLAASDCTVSPLVFAKLLTEVEPSDCVHFNGIAHVNHLTGDLLGQHAPPTGLRALIVDCGGEIDTLGFDRERARGVYREHETRITGALRTLERGLRDDDATAIAQAATESARLSQFIHRKLPFEDLLALVTGIGALGVNCAHSGSVLGVLYLHAPGLGERLIDAVAGQFGSSLGIVGDHAIISGGCDAE